MTQLFHAVLDSADATTATEVPLYEPGTEGQEITVGSNDQIMVDFVAISGPSGGDLRLFHSTAAGTATGDWRTLARDKSAIRLTEFEYDPPRPLPAGHKLFLYCDTAGQADAVVFGIIIQRD